MRRAPRGAGFQPALGGRSRGTCAGSCAGLVGAAIYRRPVVAGAVEPGEIPPPPVRFSWSAALAVSASHSGNHPRAALKCRPYQRAGWKPAPRGLAMAVLLALSLCAAACAQPPAPFLRGTYLAGDGKATAIPWTGTGLQLSEPADALHLEVPATGSGTADSAVLSLAPLRLYTLTMTGRRGPGVGLLVWVKWLEADKKPGQRLMVWQMPTRFRINWYPLSALKTTYAQRFCLPAGATQPTLQIALTGHPDPGYNYFDLYDLTMTRGAEVPYGATLGPNLLPGGDMEAATEDGMALGWGFWGANPGAQVVEKDPQGRPAHEGRHFLSFPAGKNCILVDGDLPIQPGRAYRYSFWARGQGDLGVGVQSLEASQGQRVADAQQFPIHLDAADWQQYGYTWYAEALYTASANLFMGINTRSEVDLDDVEFQLISP